MADRKFPEMDDAPLNIRIVQTSAFCGAEIERLRRVDRPVAIRRRNVVAEGFGTTPPPKRPQWRTDSEPAKCI